MDVLTAILACSLYHDDQLVRAIVRVNSQEVPYFVGDTANLVSYDYPKDLAAGQAALRKVLEKKGRPAVGLMAVPLEWASTFGREPDELFDACTNIAIGTAMLSTFDYECSTSSAAPSPAQHPAKKARGKRAQRRGRRARAPRACVVEKFGAALGIKLLPQAIFMALASQAPADHDAEEASAASSAIFPDGTNEASMNETPTWSSDSVFLRGPGTAQAPSQPPTLATPAPTTPGRAQSPALPSSPTTTAAPIPGGRR